MNTEIEVKNPYNLAPGGPCYTILIKVDFTGASKKRIEFEGAYGIPLHEASYHPDPLEGAATLAFLTARRDGLEAPMMAYCSFFYDDQELDEWVEILFAD